MAKKAPTKAEKDHMDRVSQLGCMICGRSPELHHPMSMRVKGRALHKNVIPLCFNHHSAQTPLPYGEAIHKGDKTFQAKYGTEAQLLEQVRHKLRMRGLPDGSEL